MTEYTERDLSSEGIAALARHYGVTEDEITADMAELTMSEWGVTQHDVSLEYVTSSLIAALGALNDIGLDDAAVTAAEDGQFWHGGG